MAEKEKTTAEEVVEEVKEEQTEAATEETAVEETATEETVVEEPAEEKAEETPAPEKEAKKEKKEKKSGKKGFILPVIIAAVVVVAALVFTIIMGVSATGAYGKKDYKAAYTSSKFALFLAGQDKDIIAREYITEVLCKEGKYFTATKILEKTGFSEEEKSKIYATDETFSLCNKGKVVTFGKYETDNNMGNGADGLEWIVLDITEVDGRAYAFLLTKDVIGTPGGWNRFASSESNTSYAQSNLHSWCESDFYNSFVMQDTSLREKVVAMKISTEDSSGGIDSGEDVVAHAYAPSIQELEKYLVGDLAQYLKASPTKAARASGVTSYGSEKIAAYYVRNIGNVEDGTQWAAGVDKNGEILEGLGMTSSSYGARVCINVDLGEIK